MARHSEWQQGATELEMAVNVDPEFADAHGNLGVHYIMLEQLNQAVAEFRRAIALDAATSMHHSNLALAYLLMHRPSEAKTEAQTAVLLDSRNARGQYLLGILLARNPGERADAEKHLSFAARELPEAHLLLGKLYHAAGDESKATLEQERYRRAISTFKEKH
jgi:tetratricopeptide (TPR) repeat protein